MPTNQAFTELMQFQQDTEALASIAGRLSWDQETMMPKGSAEQRATEQAAIVRTIHTRNTDPRIADWLDKITPRGEKESANIRLMKKIIRKPAKFREILMRPLLVLRQKLTAFGPLQGRMKMSQNIFPFSLKLLN